MFRRMIVALFLSICGNVPIGAQQADAIAVERTAQWECTWCEEVLDDNPLLVKHRYNSPYPPPWTNYYDNNAHDEWVNGDCYLHGHEPCSAPLAESAWLTDLAIARLSGFREDALVVLAWKYPDRVRVERNGAFAIAACGGRMVHGETTISTGIRFTPILLWSNWSGSFHSG